jgi:cytochrome P450
MRGSQRKDVDRSPGAGARAGQGPDDPAGSATHAAGRFVPPGPRPLSPLGGLLRALFSGEGDLLSLLPREAYHVETGWLGYSRRSILIVNRPDLVRHVLADPEDIFPKSDLMVGALEPLVGNSIFVSHGATWRRQRAHLDPAFSHMRLQLAFPAMAAAVNAFAERLDRAAAAGEALSLDLAMSTLTADIICRTVFSTSLASRVAADVFDSFKVFERQVAHVEILRLILDPPFKAIAQKPEVLAACRTIRGHLSEMIDAHAAAGPSARQDIAAAVMSRRGEDGTEAFGREELIDQLGVLFLAGHETTASALIWVFYILAMQPQVMERLRAEVDEVVGDGEIGFEHLRRLPFTRNVFRETLRLYPPITFIPRVAAEAAEIGGRKVKRGAMIMIAPWTIHRHRAFWKNPDAFDPDRFSPEREGELVSGAYVPFGLGPRVCVGAAFAQTEATLIIASLARRYDFRIEAPARVRPVARLTTRPAEQLMARVCRRM